MEFEDYVKTNLSINAQDILGFIRDIGLYRLL